MQADTTPTEPPPESPPDPTKSDSAPSTKHDNSDPPRIAMIWVPGLYASANTTITAVGRRLAYALDRRAGTAGARFGVDERIEEIDRGHAGKSRRATILRTDGDLAVPAIDMFELDYAETLLRPHLEATAFRRWLEASWVVIVGLMLALRTISSGTAKSRTEKLQLIIGALWLIGLVAYVWLLLLAVLVAIQSLTGWQISAPFDASIAWLFGLWGGTAPSGDVLSQVVGGLLVVVLGSSATVPALRARLERMGAVTISAFAYLRVGRQRQALTGRLTDLIEHIAEQGDRYRRVDVIANSFGSLVTLDALFPHGSPPEPRFGMVGGLVTIGCPFDAVRVIWPSYAEGRSALPDAPAGWLNIYAPMDVFGSNFRNDDQDDAASVAVAGGSGGSQRMPLNRVFRSGQAAKGLSLIDVFVLGGFRAHGRYWGDQEEAENTCFNEIVSELFRDDPVLA